MMRAESVGSFDEGDAIRYVESLNPEDILSYDADLSKVTVNAYDMLMPRTSTAGFGDANRRVGWGSRPCSARSTGSATRTRSQASDPHSASNASSRILYPGDKTKPRLLMSLLQYMKTETKVLGVDSAPAGDSCRLQVYREVFDRFIEEFKTYEPLLSQVKNEYEMALQAQRRALDKLEPLQAQLAIHKYQAAQDMDRMREDADQKLQQCMNRNHDLERKSSLLESELESLRHQYGKISDELIRRDARNEEYVSSKIAEIRAEMDTLERRSQEELRRKEEENSELQRGLRKAHEDLASMVDAMNTLNASYANSVTRRQYEDVVKEREVATSLGDQRLQELEALTATNRALQDRITELERILKREQEDKYPDWDYVQSRCPASVQEWGLLCKDRDYNDSIVLLIRELIKAKTAKPELRREKEPDRVRGQIDLEPRFFVGLGLGAGIPKHLRFKGKIRNRRLSRKNLCLLIRDIWSAKAIYDAGPKRAGNRSSLADFLYAYLKKRFGTQEAVAEWGYNIHEACKKHQFQSVECQLFYNVLTDALDEEVYHQQSRKIERLKTLFYRLDVEVHEGKVRGIISKQEAMSALKQHWPTKGDQQFEQLQNALDADQPGGTLTYRWLFQPESESLFLDIVREQEMESREAYVTGLSDLLGTSIRMEAEKTRSKEAQTFRLTALDYSRAIARFDPGLSKQGIDELLGRGFGVRPQDLKMRTSLEVEKFLKNLRRGVVGQGSDEPI
ncbi:uncharacterized protein SPPG_03209 [Spizellomyces punctatus DAOM BR117]|uniref:Translin-associated factor X-interacting protein 1 N-terminal domain-containing protein n=1 Tax=Spizellomyces punctatus (strain DAOM BR117) TaxID=645134 RepID=A0A0L0HKN5_SPIPD|nr:uncharacterized protein SPPG_03209 [Spizellomyces punctatus DAOM BR117]KND01399.1 hypothetical protein SPPG_03209 [Spizellomyces punctatus DAOM BR117]|eukprot:XP_016609438.1 hypothetical protein SPPG_03209 [Spizellomyces punctatus DAOM BR117]